MKIFMHTKNTITNIQSIIYAIIDINMYYVPTYYYYTENIFFLFSFMYKIGRCNIAS